MRLNERMTLMCHGSRELERNILSISVHGSVYSNASGSYNCCDREVTISYRLIRDVSVNTSSACVDLLSQT